MLCGRPTTEMFNRPHWSSSALTQYLRCPLQFYFERILGLPRPSVPGPLALGAAVHEALAGYHESVRVQQRKSAEQVRADFQRAWQKQANHRHLTYADRQAEIQLVDQGIRLIETYLQEPPPENILAVEQELLTPLHNSEGEFLETPLLTVMDLVVRGSEGLTVQEIKTSGRAYSCFEAETSVQATCYLNAALEHYGEPVRFEFTVLVKTKAPKVQRLATTRTPEALGRLGDLVQMVERAVQGRIFYPVETPLNCSSCPYRPPCREWKGERAGTPGISEHYPLEGNS